MDYDAYDPGSRHITQCYKILLFFVYAVLGIHSYCFELTSYEYCNDFCRQPFAAVILIDQISRNFADIILSSTGSLRIRIDYALVI